MIERKMDITWHDPADCLPGSEEVEVLVIFSGKKRNITFDHAVEFANYDDDGWYLPTYNTYDCDVEQAVVHAWAYIPIPEEFKVD